MAAFITDTTSAQYVRPRGQVLSNAGPTTDAYVAADAASTGYDGNGAVPIETAGLTMTILPLENVGNAQELVTGLSGLLAVAYQGNQPSADFAAVFVSDVGTGGITFIETPVGSSNGWVWCLHRG